MIYVYDDQGREEYFLLDEVQEKTRKKDFKLRVDCTDGPSVTARAARLLGKSGYEASLGRWGKHFYLFRTGTKKYLAVVTGESTACRVCDTTDDAWFAFGESYWANSLFKDAKLKPPTIEV